jgi:hypothetical protein
MITQRNITSRTLDDLKPLIADNYEARFKREIPDKWFWADELALSLGADLDYYDRIIMGHWYDSSIPRAYE